MIKINKKKVYALFLHVMIIWLLLMGYGSYEVFLGIYSKLYTFIMAVIFSCGFFLYRYYKNRHINKNSLLILILLIGNILLSNLLVGNLDNDDLFLICALLTAFFLCNGLYKENFVDVYVNIMTFMAIWSLLTVYVLRPLDMSGINFMPVEYNSGRPFVYTGLSMSVRYRGAVRNPGFCREPGVYQFFLLMALFFSIEIQKTSKTNVIQTVVLLITLVSTFSTVAFVMLPICLILFIRKFSNDRKNSIRIIILTIVFASAVFILINENVYFKDAIKEALRKLDLNSGIESQKVRASGLLGNLSVFLKNILWGRGMNYAITDVISLIGDVNVTGTFLIGFTAYGILFGTIMTLFFVKCFWVKNFARGFIWSAMMTMSALSQNLILSYFIWLLVFVSCHPGGIYDYVKD